MLVVLVQAVSIYALISLTASVNNIFIILNIYQSDSEIFQIIDVETRRKSNNRNGNVDTTVATIYIFS